MLTDFKLETALRYAAMGLKVVPLYPGTKRPRLRMWPRRASLDPAVIREWLGEWPDANLGLVLGDGVLALDLDPRNGGRKSFRQLLKGRRRLPATAEALTPRRGRHILLRARRDLGCLSGKAAPLPGLDVIGHGGMIVVEPSEYKGKEYVWLRPPWGSEGIARAPDWLELQIMEWRGARSPEIGAGRVHAEARTPARDRIPTRIGEHDEIVADVISRFRVTGPGERNGRMSRAIASLVCRGYASEMTRSVMREWLVTFDGIYRTPIRDAMAELDSCIRSAYASRRLKPSRTGQHHRERRLQVRLNPRIELAVGQGRVAGEGQGGPAYLELARDSQGRAVLVPDACVGPREPANHYKSDCVPSQGPRACLIVRS